MYRDWPEEHKIDMHAELMKCIKLGKTKRFSEVKYDDKVFSITMSGFPRGAIITSQDITERKLAEERLAREKEEAAARQRAERRQKMEREQDGVRWEAVQKCREHKYDEAKLLFTPMSVSREEEFKRWAGQKQACIDYAEKAFKMVHNTRLKLKGVPVPFKSKPGKWHVTDIGRRTIRLDGKQKVYKDGKAAEITLHDKIALADVKASTMWVLCKASWDKDGGDENELMLYFGAYLTAHGGELRQARKMLESSGREGEAAPILAEIEILGPKVREQQWKEQFDRLRLFVNQGEMKSARGLVRFLKQRFPDEYSTHEDEVTRLLQDE